MFDLSCHNGKYYFDDTAEFLKAVTREKKNAGRIKRIDYAMGALEARSKTNFLARASEAGSSFSYGSEDDAVRIEGGFREGAGRSLLRCAQHAAHGAARRRAG